MLLSYAAEKTLFAGVLRDGSATANSNAKTYKKAWLNARMLANWSYLRFMVCWVRSKPESDNCHDSYQLGDVLPLTKFHFDSFRH